MLLVSLPNRCRAVCVVRLSSFRVRFLTAVKFTQIRVRGTVYYLIVCEFVVAFHSFSTVLLDPVGPVVTVLSTENELYFRCQ